MVNISEMMANNTNNNTNTTLGPLGPTIIPTKQILLHWGVWSIWILLGVLIVIGNSLIIAVYTSWKQLRTPTNTFLVMLAAADILVGVVFIPLYIGGHYIAYYKGFSISDNLDMVLLFTVFASVFNLYAVTADRYIAVLHALRYNALMTTKTVYCFAAAAWFFPAIITAIVLISNFVNEDIMPIILFVIEIVFVIIPGTIMTFVYVKIFQEARKQIIQVAALERHDNNSANARTNKRKAEHKVAQTCALLLFVFVMCWLPTFIEQILDMAEVEVATIYRDFAIIFMISNSAVNPFLYGLIKRDFRSKLKRIFLRIASRNVTQNNATTYSNVSNYNSMKELKKSTDKQNIDEKGRQTETLTSQVL